MIKYVQTYFNIKIFLKKTNNHVKRDAIQYRKDNAIYFLKKLRIVSFFRKYDKTSLC